MTHATPPAAPSATLPADLRALTTLRFFAALWVVLFAAWPNLDVGFVPTVVAKGYLGVEVFFVLSGFILSHVYLAAAGEKRFSYGGFLWARLARVYPLHLATLFGVMALGLGAVAVGMSIDGNVLSWDTLPAHLAMVHAWGFASEAGWNHPSWSISAEWFAYLAFPAFAALTWPMRNRPVLATALAAGFALGLYAVFERAAGFSLTEATFHWGALRIVPCFLLGCALYLVHRRVRLPRPALLASLFGALMLGSAALGLWDGVTVLLAGGLVLALGSLPNGGWTGSRLGVWLGEISYSVYMVCVPWKLLAINLAAKATGAEDKLLHPVVWLAVVLALVPVAGLTHALIERPARSWLRGVADRRRRASKAGTGAEFA